MTAKSLLRDALCQPNGAGWTDQTAEVTTHTLGANETGMTGLMIEDNRLMSTIAT